MITPNIPDVLDDLNRSEGSAGLLVAAGAMPAVFLAPIIGVLADRFGRKPVLLPCLVVFAVGAAAGSVAPTFPALIGARLLQGAGGAGLINLALVLIADHWSGLERTRLIGRNSAVITAALALAPVLSGGIAELTNWRVSVAVGALALPVALVGLAVLPDTRPGVHGTVLGQLRAAGAVIRQPELLMVLVAGFALFLVIFGVFLTALPVHLEEEFGLGPGVRGLILSLSAVGATIAAFNLDRIRGVLSLRILLSVCCLIIAVAAFGMAVAPALALVVLANLLYGFGDGALIPALQDVATSVPAPEQRGSVMAAWVVSIRLGQTAGPLGAAALFARYSTGTAMVAGAVIFAAVGIGFLLGPIDDATLDRADTADPH